MLIPTFNPLTSDKQNKSTVQLILQINSTYITIETGIESQYACTHKIYTFFKIEIVCINSKN